ncbi:MAG TPA: efflux RND transporter periplasmic adaptor subunit [Puia sp.]|nr:efflux RND transporter periplasmic adaptor subunit [Puia sp.]
MHKHLLLFCSIGLAAALTGCNTTSGNPEAAAPPPPPSLQVISVTNQPVTLYKEFNASLEGTKNIDIRSQVDGYLEKIFVDEGAFVKKGQPLFRLDARPFTEQLNNARATVLAAKANLSSAEINVSKLEPLVKNNVVSDVQLKTAQAAYDAARANVAQAEAQVSNAQINLGYALISAPVDGYIGRIPSKIGSLVVRNDAQALTVLSEIREVYAYFSLSENDFIQFKNQFAGRTIEDKIKQLPPVELILSDNTVYPQKGKVGTVDGQFSRTMGTISFRASFPNVNGLLRSGNTGKIRIPQSFASTLVIPQEATYELQDKIFVFAVGDSNKVAGKPITVTGRSGNYYLVDKGISPGDKIVYTGLDRLRDGMIIAPKAMSLDSLLKARPM